MAKDDPAIVRMRELFADSGKTLDELGVAMGFESGVARKSAWQLLNKVANPRLDTLRKFASALSVPITALFAADEKAPAKGRG